METSDSLEWQGGEDMLQLQRVLLPTDEVCKVQGLYYHQSGEWIHFDGYFNLFYIEKRKKYTKINNLHLKLKLKGYKEIQLLHDQKEIHRGQLIESELREYSFELPYGELETGFFSFALASGCADAGRVLMAARADAECGLTSAHNISEQVAEGFYCTELDSAECREVNIGIDICTFKREAYVRRNLKQLKDRLLENPGLDVYGHLKIYIVDNGGTLGYDTVIQGLVAGLNGAVQIYPNKNAGGVGGFTRGLLEILQEKESRRLTHALLMDDDAVIEADSLVRLYGLLVTIRDEWQQAAVGGGIFREEHPEFLYTAGEWWQRGVIVAPKPLLDMRLYENCTCDYIARRNDETRSYSGWWCCCYPLVTANEKNLPLPLFIHGDDVEYGLRNAVKGIIYMNGIDVWHRGFESTMPRTNLYYDVRNNLILLALYGGAEAERIAWRYMAKQLHAAILRLRYQECKVVYQALLDFLKGPEWLLKAEPTDVLDKVNRISYRLSEYGALKQDLNGAEYDRARAQIEAYCKNFGMKEIRKKLCGGQKIPMIKYLTYNGWVLPAQKGIAAISVLESPFAMYRKKKVVIFEPLTKKYMITKRDHRKLLRCFIYNIKCYVKIKKGFTLVQKSYMDKKAKLSDAATWRTYLELDR